MTSYLLTGGTGSFGRAYAKRLLTREDTRRVVVLSRDEAKQAAMRAEMPDPRLRWFVGDVRDAERVETALRGVDVVVHAAALKRVEVCEENPVEAVATNLTGTHNVAQAALRAGVRKAVLLSTDKAVAPNTHYGSTKLAAERLWTRMNVYAAGQDTRFSATRYGNVLGSRGSVLGTWQAQHRAGEPLTVTDERCTRFWMRMQDACDLVDLAIREMRGGEVFIPKIGAASTLDLARAVVEGGGTYAPGHVCTGLRPGEKLHESLVGEDEARACYDCGDHYRIEPDRTWGPALEPVGTPVPDGWTYRSDTTDALSVQQLREMIGG